ncbi:MAG: sugar phosphate nucleotidyltransferase [archaeon]
MKLIIPMAGKGTRLLPHTYTRAKPLIYVAGKPLLAHILDRYKRIRFEEVIFIVGEFQEDVKKFITKNYSFKATFVEQKEKKGNAHAVSLAKPYIKDTDEIGIVFADTIFDGDFSIIDKVSRNKISADGIIWVREVPNPERFGVVIKEGKYATKIVEKPSTPISNEAIIGWYYFKQAKALFESIDYIISNEIMTKNEYYLSDAIQLMINNNHKLLVEHAEFWLDCGTAETLLSTNQALLKNNSNVKSKPHNSIILKPVFIEKNVIIKNAIIGPNVSIAAGAIVENAIIHNSIINDLAVINDAVLHDSIVGSKAVIKGHYTEVNIGDNSEITYGIHKDD